MAITPTASTDQELTLTFNNGDLVFLRDTMRRLGFQNEQSMIRFMLAVLSKSATRSVTIVDANGARVSVNPSPDLLVGGSNPTQPTT